MNKEVRFSLAQLLKEKEYHENCWQCYRTIEATEDRLSWWKIGELNKPMNCTFSDKNDAYYGLCSAPTIREVVMWLYEKHGIWISVLQHSIKGEGTYFESVIGAMTYSGYNSPTEAYEKAIEYTLKKLI